MRASSWLAVTASLIGTAGIVCLAQSPTTAAPAGNVAYVTFFDGDGLMGELSVDGFLKESFQGGKVTSAVLDVCHSVSADSSRKDRFVVALKLQNGKLVGSAESQEEKVPVSVSLARKASGSSISFDGTITRGSAALETAADDKTEQSEEEFRQSQPQPDTLDQTPKDFTEVSPDSLVVKVKRASLAAVVKALRAEDVELAFDTLATSCDVLRSGEHVLKLNVDPERGPALLAKLKALPGVSAAGYGAGTFSMERAIRFPAAPFRTADGKLDRPKIAAAAGAAVAKGVAAELRSSEWDATTGVLSLKFARPDNSVAGLDLVQLVDTALLIGPEKPGASDNLILWVGDVTAETVDEGAGGQKLKFTGATVGGAEEDQPQSKDSDAPVAQLIQALKGQGWDPEKFAWK
jgi:hypothetical protein